MSFAILSVDPMARIIIIAIPILIGSILSSGFGLTPIAWSDQKLSVSLPFWALSRLA